MQRERPVTHQREEATADDPIRQLPLQAFLAEFLSLGRSERFRLPKVAARAAVRGDRISAVGADVTDRAHCFFSGGTFRDSDDIARPMRSIARASGSMSRSVCIPK
jgi:hypothetical protein